MVFLLLVMTAFFTMFNLWRLSYWLEQGSGVSAMVGVGCISVGLGRVGGFLFLGALWARVREAHGKPIACPCGVDEGSSRGKLWEPELWGFLPVWPPVFTEHVITYAVS